MYSWKTPAAPLGKGNSISPKESCTQQEVVLTTVFLKEVIHVMSSIKYLLSWPLNKSGCGKSTLYDRGLGDSLKLTCFTRLFSYLFQATNNFQSHLMFMNPHSHTVHHPTKTPTAHAHFLPMCGLRSGHLPDCWCSTPLTFPLLRPAGWLTSGWNYHLGISICFIMSLILERYPKKEKRVKETSPKQTRYSWSTCFFLSVSRFHYLLLI